MNFIIENNEEKVIIRCHVEKLDTLNAPELKSHFLHQSQQNFSHFIVDLSRVKYCDSSGLSALLVGNRLAKEKKSKMVLFGLQPSVKKIISISQLDTVFNIVSTENDIIN